MRKRVTVSITDAKGALRPLDEIELEIIRKALERHRNKSVAARRLGIGRSMLYRKIREMEHGS